MGNLIWSATFALGTYRNVVVASVPDGDDKPYKYPNTYRGIDALILNEADLLPYVDFDSDTFRQGMEALNPGVAFFILSRKTGAGIADGMAWLQGQMASMAQPALAPWGGLLTKIIANR